MSTLYQLQGIFVLIAGYFFRLFCMLDNFWCMPEIMNVNLLSAGCFCISKSVLGFFVCFGFFFWVAFQLLGNRLLHALHLRCVSWTTTMLSIRLSLLWYRGHVFCTLGCALRVVRLSNPANGSRCYSQNYVSPGHSYLSFFGVVISLTSGSFLTGMFWWILAL